MRCKCVSVRKWKKRKRWRRGRKSFLKNTMDKSKSQPVSSYLISSFILFILFIMYVRFFISGKFILSIFHINSEYL